MFLIIHYWNDVLIHNADRYQENAAFYWVYNHKWSTKLIAVNTTTLHS